MPAVDGRQRHLAQPILLLLKRRLTDPLLSEESYRRLEAIRNIGWGIWLTSDASDWNLPPVSDAQIEGWLTVLGQPVAKRDMPRAPRNAASPARSCWMFWPRIARCRG